MRALLGSLVMLGLTLAPTASAADVYAINLRGSTELVRFPVGAPADNVLATGLPYSMFALDFNSAATTLYGVTYDGTAAGKQFGTVNQTNGAFTPIAPISGAAAAETNIGGLSVDPTNETFYAASGTTLYRLDPGTGNTTLVGNFFASGSTSVMIDIAIGPDGSMYGHDIVADQLVSINKTTGLSTPIGATGQAANFAQGMDFNYETGELLATIYTGGGTGVFARFDLATGAAIPIVSTTPWNNEMEMAVKAPIPEPTTMVLLALGTLLLRRR